MEQLSMLLVIFAALVIPIVMARFNLKNIPTAVAEIIVGIIIGKSGLHLVSNNSQLAFLADLGVILLMFLSGMEINFDLFKKEEGRPKEKVNPLYLALGGFISILVAAGILAALLRAFGLFKDVVLATIIFSTVALGVVIATLKEKEILNRPIGQTILLTAVFGEVIPLFGLTFYASINGGNGGTLWLIVFLFIAAIVLLLRFKRPYQWFTQITKSTTQVDIRLAFFLIFTLVTVAETVGAENILGAFLAGIIMKLLQPSESTKDKLTSIGYGFFIPFFFIMTGVKLDLISLFTNAQALMLVPVLIICFFLAKMPVAVIYARFFNKRNALAGGFLTATTITIVLPALQVARKLNVMTSTQSAAFTLAAIVVCIVSPIIFNSKFELTPEDKIKERVTIVGATVSTVPVAQELHDKWYSVKMVATNEQYYNTYKSRVADMVLLKRDDESFEAANVYDCDILLVAYQNDDKNLEVAKWAKKHGVKRVIAYQNSPSAERIAEMKQEGIEIFNMFNIHVSAMRALIESPAFYDILLDSKSVLYDVVVKNSNYAGQRLMDWDFIGGLTVSRIRRDGKWISPHGTTIIELGDELLYTGQVTEADRAREVLSREV
ncbi:monovalent cation:proton antiporter family protein [Lactobacillus corticis]|uniref:Potassium transporter Kef n=1 Tax=Lactobacillus corticis TaxID=2201249 RepID=A0A916VHP1_9LACO|nr:cation:proton antiporter family protein [Lactobacillus corticis]GFZ26518.1 potassium transporter Kef [Lactobacillus corticis]